MAKNRKAVRDQRTASQKGNSPSSRLRTKLLDSTDANIIAHKQPFYQAPKVLTVKPKRPRLARGRTQADANYDPYRRLIAGYVAQAVYDYHCPPKSLNPLFRLTAIQFMESPVGQDMLILLGITQEKILAMLAGEL